MAQPDAFCEHTMQQNASAAKAATAVPCWGAYRSPSDPLAGFKREWEGWEEKEMYRRGVGAEKGMEVGIAISRWE